MNKFYLLIYFPPGATPSFHSPKICRLIGDSKLAVGVTVSVNRCLFLYISPMMNRQPIQLCQCQLGLAPAPCDPANEKQ